MVEKVKSTNETLLELLVGIIMYGTIAQIIGLFLHGNKLFFSVGLWCGIGVALFMAIHIYRSLVVMLELSEKDSGAYLRNKVLIRTAVVVIVLFLVYISKLGNPVVYCFGVLGLKIAAFLQPMIHRFLCKSEKTNNDSSNKNEEVNV